METPDESLTRAATRGGFSLFTTGGVTLLASLGAQIALGWLLSEDDFGVYAIAIGFSTFLLVFQDAGVRLWLLRLGHDRFRDTVGDAFWLTVGFSVLVAALLAAASPAIAAIYGEPELVMVILTLAIATLFVAYPKIAMAWLLVDLHFQTAARIEVASAVIRYALMVGLAYAGFGPLSFVLPVIAVNLFEGVAGWATTRFAPWSRPFSLRRSLDIFRFSRWPMAGSLASASVRQSDYFALGLLATTNVVGIYFFAYQFTSRLLSLFSESLRKVVLPTFATTDADRLQRAAVRASAFLGLMAAPVLLLLGVVAAPLEELLWRGRWDSAVAPIQILALIMPVQLLTIFVEMIVQSRGRFRLWAGTIALRGVGLAFAAFAAGWVASPNPATSATLIIGSYLFLSGLIEIVILSRRIDLSSMGLLRASGPPYAIAGLVAVSVLLLERFLEALPVLGLLVAMGAIFIVLYGSAVALLLRGTFNSALPILRELPGVGRLFAR
jgi:O-antigen/teichoic acid export membrane protein